MTWKEFVSEYLNFSRRDRIAVIAVIAIILLIFFLPEFISNNRSIRSAPADTSWVAAMKKLEQKESGDDKSDFGKFNNNENSNNYQYDRPTGNYYSKTKEELFYFDPNNLSTEGWQRLGLRDKTIHTIQNYLSKGGHFKKPEDLQKIYGLFPDEYERIAPYIKIESSAENTDNAILNKLVTDNQPVKTYASRYSVIEINTADTTAFISLPGIGSKLAARIVNFRDKLGGFYSVNQVGETFGLPDSTFQKIKQYLKLENVSVRKININTATVDELKAHPYIRYSLANPIVAYRNEHGPFGKIEDIKKVMAMTEEIYNKIAPYLVTQ